MAEEKRYWWLQMEHDFFEQKEMKALKRMSAGYVYTTIYLKLLLKSLKNNGSLFFESIEDDFISEIAFDIDEAVDDVGAVFDFLKRKGLLIEISEDEVSLPGAVQRIGSKTQSAVRMERMRAKQKEAESVTKLRSGVTSLHDSYVEKRREKKRIDIEQLQLEQEEAKQRTDRPKKPPENMGQSWDNHRADVGQQNISKYNISQYNISQQQLEAGAGKNPIFEKLKETFGEMSINGTIVQEVNDLLGVHGEVLLLHALDETILGGGRSINYTRSILERWQGQGLRTIEQIKQHNDKYRGKSKANAVPFQELGRDEELGF